MSDPAAFHRYMESVDDRLKADGVEIAGRPVHALGLVSGELRLSFTLKDDIALRMNKWFEDRYGPRLLIDFSIGSMLVEIREDPYVAKYPLIYGTVTINPLSFIQGVTGGIFAGMVKSDIDELATVINRGFEAFVSMQKVPPALHSDLTNAVVQMVKRPADAAMSKWSSQQAIEKTLNGFIAGRGRDPKRRTRGTHVHDLLPLVDLAEEIGLAHLDRKLVAEVQCSASARYPGRVTVSPKKAIRANQASVNLCEPSAVNGREVASPQQVKVRLPARSASKGSLTQVGIWTSSRRGRCGERSRCGRVEGRGGRRGGRWFRG